MNTIIPTERFYTKYIDNDVYLIEKIYYNRLGEFISVTSFFVPKDVYEQVNEMNGFFSEQFQN